VRGKMNREFKTKNNKRYVWAAEYKFHVYHLECAPKTDETRFGFYSTEKTRCHYCGGRLFLKAIKESEAKNDN
jgi:DNA-directed RNA polymerase subunit RPC12/RpoP